MTSSSLSKETVNFSIPCSSSTRFTSPKSTPPVASASMISGASPGSSDSVGLTVPCSWNRRSVSGGTVVTVSAPIKVST
jgi:hypothetical protein